jgi:hypothetical protein
VDLTWSRAFSQSDAPFDLADADLDGRVVVRPRESADSSSDSRPSRVEHGPHLGEIRFFGGEEKTT